MTFARPETFRPVGQILAASLVPAALVAARLPLRIYCLGTVNQDAGDDALGCDRLVPLGQCDRPELAMHIAAMSLSSRDIRASARNLAQFRPRLVLIQDRDHCLVLAGEIRAGTILWQQPVTSDAEARQVVIEASKLRGMAFRETDAAAASKLQDRAAVLEGRLVDPFWRETASDLLRFPQAA